MEFIVLHREGNDVPVNELHINPHYIIELQDTYYPYHPSIHTKVWVVGMLDPHLVKERVEEIRELCRKAQP